MAAAAAAAAKPPSSPFAAMLRRSKFSSFDPEIAQVYTTYGGDAHRGNWGLKRPLPLHARNRYITVQSVDSREQQTEWKHAQAEARFIKRWDEQGVQPKAHGMWDQQTGRGRGAFVMDSDFALATRDAGLFKPKDQMSKEEEAEMVRRKEYESAVPNVAAMSEREFQRYLEELRKQRPEFKKYVAEEYAKQEAAKAAGGKPTVAVAATLEKQVNLSSAATVRKNFLKKYAYKLYSSPESTVIEQQPHPNAGATYAKVSPLTTYYTTKPHPGRVLAFRGGNNTETKAVSFAGMVSSIASWVARDTDTISVRLASARLTVPPRTVGEHPTGLANVQMDTKVLDQEKIEDTRFITAQPGTRAYIEMKPTAQRSRLPTASNTTRRHIPSGRPAANTGKQQQLTSERNRHDVINRLRDLLQDGAPR